MAPTVWTARRKWLGNLLPALFWFPLLVVGLAVMAKQGDPLGAGLGFLVAATILGWLAVNQWGLFENERMQGQLERILKSKEVLLADETVFVGFATPKYSSALDPHEDVGYLSIEPQGLRFLSESRQVDVPHGAVTNVRFRTNVHSLLFLGRWISVEGEMDGHPIRLLIEPRVHRTLARNRRESSSLLRRLQEWSKERATAA